MAYVTQTTLSQDDIAEVLQALEKRFPGIEGPISNICYATQNRQNAVKELAGKTDLLFVVGSKNSSNSNRLREVGKRQGIDCYLIDDAGDIDPAWFEGVRRVGVTAGASAPERLVDGVIHWLQDHGATTFHEMAGKREKVRFMPAELEEY
jgi:4-hydroxy-3-methylbut-2-enyl diphosphate reductase